MVVTIREIRIKDVQALISLMQQVFEASEYMLYDPGEYIPSLERATSKIEKVITSPHLAILVAEDNDQLVGYLTIKTTPLKRIKHTAKISMGVLQAFQKRGIGFELLNFCKKWCKAHDISRIELNVVTQNTAAYQFYKKANFTVEGEIRHSIKINDHYFNEYIMAYLLE
ncbi:GNAT family N-acetyltransferase [Staphylococcus felis]|uniref:GNAT family N-acetyltransferase n=1 Tax=Staphylococcus felis TaxID=46127 RepID=A0A3E0IJQ6_9STAP|nr:GNAT family N-acetyltransferase [Staphylococcus felis]MBH9580813.1 GNAT family N-acetyltransferase [Staphylococcus felis]MDM8327467.1 GNAT family N-acetyltransferase [Staphylococcus felis]MDQ7193144.1 GNAT family N-acetyltransferase [Staphylococcus felis]REH74516.1 GNAT family N-acetyltransferase [Staphylococcus felis]REH79975.1 GNAT family N-acetyltransferase [Staphylococcus felis]